MTPLTWNVDQQDLGGGSFQARISGKWRNFLSDDGWQPIDIAPRQAGGLFTVNQAPYRAEYPTQADGWSVFESTNRYDIWTKQVRDDAAVGLQKRYLCDPVNGEITKDGVLYPLAFPALMADRLVQFHEQKVRDLIVFRSEPPGKDQVEVPFELDYGSLPVLESRGRGQLAIESDFRSDKDVVHGLSFTESDFRGVKIKRPRVWDSAGHSAHIKLRGKTDGSRFIGVKVIPRAFFKDAVYPVYADTTTTFYPDPNTETTSVDGYVGRSVGNEPWSTKRNGTGNTFADDQSFLTAGYTDFGAASNLWNGLYRVLTLFDTSGLGSGASISAAALGLKSQDAPPGGHFAVNITQGTTASNTALANSDYEGNTAATTRFSDSDIADSSFVAEVYSVFTLNAAGRAAINATGISKFCVRVDKDIDNTAPTWVSNSEDIIDPYSAETSGTSKDPYLEVTYTATRTATAALTVDGFIGAASATFAPGTHTATSAPLTTHGATFTSSATFTKPVYAATAPLIVDNFSLTSAATFVPPTYTAAAALTSHVHFAAAAAFSPGTHTAIAAAFVAPATLFDAQVRFKICREIARRRVVTRYVPHPDYPAGRIVRYRDHVTYRCKYGRRTETVVITQIKRYRVP